MDAAEVIGLAQEREWLRAAGLDDDEMHLVWLHNLRPPLGILGWAFPAILRQLAAIASFFGRPLVIIMRSLMSVLAPPLAVIQALLRAIFSLQGLCIILVLIVTNRVYVFAATRRPVQLSKSTHIFLRGIALVTLFYTGSLLVPHTQALLKAEGPISVTGPTLDEAPGHGLWARGPRSFGIHGSMLFACIVLGLSHVIDALVATVQHERFAADFGFPIVEFAILTRFVGSMSTMERSDSIALLVAVAAVCAHSLVHLEGLLKLQHYHLITSTVVGFTIIGLTLYDLAFIGGREAYNFGSFTAQAMRYPLVTRTLLKMIGMAVLIPCWSIYLLSALIAGGFENMSMHTVHGNIAFTWADSLDLALLKLAFQALSMQANSRYLREALYINLQRETFVDKYIKVATCGTGVSDHAGGRGYATKRSDPPQTTSTEDAANEYNPFFEGRPIYDVVALFVRLRAMLVLATVWLRLVALRSLPVRWTQGRFLGRALGAERGPSARPRASFMVTDPAGRTSRLDSVQSVVELITFRYLDRGFPNAHLALLTARDLPAFDDSPSYEAATEAEDSDESDASSDWIEADSDHNSDDELASDRALVIENLAGAYANSQTTALATGHMQSHRALTRRMWLALGNSDDKLLAVIQDRRGPGSGAAEAVPNLCVVCMVEPRNIVTWPCRCFALCDECRAALSIQGMDSCVACRQAVESYSRINIP